MACLVKLEGQQCTPTRVEVCVALGSGPTLSITLTAGHPWLKSCEGSAVMSLLGKRGELEWAGHAFSFCCTGVETANNSAHKLVGILLSDDVIGWFQSKVAREEWDVKVLVYQRHNEDANAWGFVRRALGNRFATPFGADQLDRCFPHGACILRSGEATNLAHVERVIGLLSAMPTRARGWCAFNTEDDVEPLRLVGLDAPPHVLDAGWEPEGATQVSLPHPITHGTGRSRLRRGFGVLAPEQAAAVLFELTSAGTLSERDDLLGDPSQAPTLPGLVQIGSFPAFCPEFRYEFVLPKHDQAGGVQLEVELDFCPLPHSAGLNESSQTVTTAFSHWEEAPKIDGTLYAWQLSEREHRLAVGSQFSRTWRMMGDGAEQEMADAGKCLICDATTPFASRGEFSGFYVSYRPDDFLVVALRDGEVPVLQGQLQTFAPELEGPDLVINSPTVTVSGLPNNGALAAADGLVLNGPDGTVEVYAEKHVALKQKVTITDDKTYADHNAVISETLNVGGDTTLHGTGTVVKAVKMEDSLHVAGKAEVEGSFRVAQALDIKA